MELITLLTLYTMPQVCLLCACAFLLCKDNPKRQRQLPKSRLVRKNAIRKRKSVPFTITDLKSVISDLKQVHILVPKDSSTYNTHSPMSNYIKNKLLPTYLITYPYQSFTTLSYKLKNKVSTRVAPLDMINYSPMHNLCITREFIEHIMKGVKYYRSQRSYLWYMRSAIHPMINSQYNIIRSKPYRQLLNDSLLLAKLNHFMKKEQYIAQISSPMHKYINDNGNSIRFLAEARWKLYNKINYNIRVSPMRNFIQLYNIYNKLQLFISPLKKYTINNKYKILSYKKILNKNGKLNKWKIKASIIKSPLRHYTILNSNSIHCRYTEFVQCKYQRYKTLIPINSAIKQQYARNIMKPICIELLEKKDTFRNIQNYMENNIPFVHFTQTHATRVVVTFPIINQAHEFISASNLDDFNITTLCKSKDVKIEYCSSVLPYKIAQNRIITAVQSLKNMTNIVLGKNEKATVHVFTDNNCLSISPISLNNTSSYRHAIIKFIKRDQGKFNNRTYNMCNKALNQYMKTSKIPMQFSLGFTNIWLGNELQIILSVPVAVISSKDFTHITSDIIIRMNIIKDVIYTSLNNEICWMCI